MQVIMLQYVKSVGKPGTIVSVKPGYAKNFLVPRGFAEYATKKNLASLATKTEELVAKDQVIRSIAEHLYTLVNEQTYTLERLASDDDKLYGSITKSDVVSVINQTLTLQGERNLINKEHIRITSPIKILGEHTILLHLHDALDAKITINVQRKLK